MSCDCRQLIQEHGIVSISRKIYGQQLMLLSDVLAEAGILFMEVTYDQQDPQRLAHTGDAIRQLAARHPEMMIGAGTVLTKEEVANTQQAGGRFIVSPNTDAEVIGYTKELGLGSVPGAMSPSEIMTAYNAGADVVKLFPADKLGIGYIKDIRAPLSHIPLLATGGVKLDNFADFLQAGCCGAGIGGALSNKKLLESGDRQGLLALARDFVRIFKENV